MTSSDDTNDGSPSQPYDRDEVQALYFQMDTLLHNRVNSLLLAESIFFLVAATLLKMDKAILLAIVCILGVVTTVMFGFTNLKLYYRVIWLLRQLRCSGSQLYQDYINLPGLRETFKRGPDKLVLKLITNDRQPEWMATGWLYSWGLSGICLCGWITFFIVGLSG